MKKIRDKKYFFKGENENLRATDEDGHENKLKLREIYVGILKY